MYKVLQLFIHIVQFLCHEAFIFIYKNHHQIVKNEDELYINQLFKIFIKI
jgi:hypothetical protein